MNRIVVVEDDPAILRGLADNLRAESYEVLSAADGSDGYRLVCDERPDLVILDVMLPDGDGRDLLRRHLARLAASGRPVADPTLARLTADYIRWQLGDVEKLTRGWRRWFLAGVLLFLLVIALAGALRGDWVQATTAAVAVGVAVVGGLLIAVAQRRWLRTARANGWEL